MSTQTKINHLRALEKEMHELGGRINEAEESLLADISPYKVGDVIGVCGYSFTHKKGKVMSISLDRTHSGGFDIRVMVNVARKDGTVTHQTTAWNSYHDEKLKEALSKLK